VARMFPSRKRLKIRLRVLEPKQMIARESHVCGSGGLITYKGELVSELPGDRTELMVSKPSIKFGATVESSRRSKDVLGAGTLIMNADDWGRDPDNTDRTLECIRRGTVSSVSAMVFMKDSERAAAIARERGIDAGLHLNFTMPFSVPNVSTKLMKHQERVSRYLSPHRFAQVVFHPGLVSSFEYLVAAQREEFCRLYGAEPSRLDGHHHMHLCSNVLLANLLPQGTMVRRSFSFQPGEKSFGNRLYRNVVDRMLTRRHQLTDYFFSLPPLAPPGRLQRIFSLANEFTVEVETHPVVTEEREFLLGEEILQLSASIRIATSFAVNRGKS
jgi:predicted glycoside hydrolase/deacetylase ChbG (UPF0249 family)